MIDIKYELIAQTKKHRWSIRRVGKFHWVWYILIFHGHNQYKSFSKLLFHLASISLKNRNIWKIHTKSFEILCKKSVLLSFLVILSLVLKIEYSYWNCTEFCITLKQPKYFDFLVKLKPNEKAILKMICIDCNHRISKCTRLSEFFPPV